MNNNRKEICGCIIKSGGMREMESMKKMMHADEYLRHVYTEPEEPWQLPLPDEAYLPAWKDADKQGILDVLRERFSIEVDSFPWTQPDTVRLLFIQTLAGRLPVIRTGAHEDFCNLAAMLNGVGTAVDYPPTINACMMQARHERIYHHRILLMNDAPYSNVSAERLGLTSAEWLERSAALRLRHECAHYETLRLFGGMQNHALDEIVADTMGQIAAFGDFSAERQRIFFGLARGGGQCDGRLNFYTQRVFAGERSEIYRLTDQRLDVLEPEIRQAQAQKADDYELLRLLATRTLMPA